MENTIIFESNENFSVPISVVDKYLDAPEVELRLILFLLRYANHSFLKEELEKKLGIDEKRLKGAFDYWVKRGLLFKIREKYVLERPRVTASDAIKYSADRISERMESDKKIFFLYKQTEEALRKPLTPEIASTVLSLVDFIGLSPEVAAMLIQYCADEKNSLHSITSLGIEWSEKGIDTFEKAEAYLKEMKTKKETANKISRLLGISGRKLLNEERELFIKWNDEFGYGGDVINLAYEASIKNTGKYQYKYMDKVLSAWNKKGYKTAEEIKNNDEKPTVKTRKKRIKSDNDAEIDTKSSAALSWEILTKDIEEEK